MQVRVITLRNSDGLQGFSEDALRKATFGRQVLSVEKEFFFHGGVPHLLLLLTLADAEDAVQSNGLRRLGSDRPDPAEKLPEDRKGVYAALRTWRNDLAKAQGRPAYTIARNGQLAELVLRAPKTIAEIKEIEGCGEAFCKMYGKEILKMLEEVPPAAAGEEAAPTEDVVVSEEEFALK